jgi:hypothetical protein
MAKCLCSGAKIECSFGDGGPQTMNVMPLNLANTSSNPIGNALDAIPMANIPAFGNCTSMMNPMVAAATAAAMGALTPQPCIPLPLMPMWSGGASKTTLKGQPVLTEDSTCSCAWGGQITVNDPGQTDVDVN